MTTLAIRFSNLAAVEKVLRNQFVDLCQHRIDELTELKNHYVLKKKIREYKYELRLRSIKTFLRNIVKINSNTEFVDLLSKIEISSKEDKQLRKEFRSITIKQFYKEKSETLIGYRLYYSSLSGSALSTLAKFCKENNL